MPLVVLLRGVNVGGHRIFRPAVLAKELQHLDAINIGAAGTLVIRQPITQAALRVEVARRLPFDATIIICRGSEILSLIARDPFAAQPVRPGVVRFVSILSKRPREALPTPILFPAKGQWLVKVLGTDARFVLGMYRRHPKVISYLGAVDRLFTDPITTRNWNTIASIAKVLEVTRGEKS